MSNTPKLTTAQRQKYIAVSQEVLALFDKHKLTPLDCYVILKGLSESLKDAIKEKAKELKWQPKSSLTNLKIKKSIARHATKS